MEKEQERVEIPAVFEIDSGFDQPDERDFAHFDVFEFGGSATPGVKNRRSPLFNQNAQKETFYACPIYGLTHAYNEGNAIERETLGIETGSFENPLDVTREIVSKDIGFNPNRGWYMQPVLKYFMATGRIAGYTLVKKAGDGDWKGMVDAIDRGFLLYTGSNRVKWSTMVKERENVVIIGDSYGHIFCIDGYHWDGDVLVFHIRQSVGTGYFDNGYAYVTADQLTELYSVYSVIDKDDSESLLSYKAKKNGIWNGERPDAIATRMEFATMLARGSVKPIQSIYSGERPDDVPTDSERNIMADRAFGKKTSAKTRKETAVFSQMNAKWK